MSTEQVIDWFRLLWDLVQRGHSIADVSKTSGIAESTIKGYLRGSHPPHWRGERLVALWCQTCDRTRDDLPMAELFIAPRVVTRNTGPAMDESMKELERAWR